MQFIPKPYQKAGIEHLEANAASLALIDMGLGKTVMVLTDADNELYNCMNHVSLLVIAPSTICHSVWPEEIAKWNHTKHLTCSIVAHPSAAKRKKALEKPADIYLINPENIDWLVGHYGLNWPFPYVCIDESSKFKNPQSQRFKALRQIRPKIDKIILMSGTPTPKSLMDLWAQMYLVDRGERLGAKISDYRNEYFKPNQRKGMVIFNYKLADKAYEQAIYTKIEDVAISMKKEDWLDLPERKDVFVNINLSPENRVLYDEFEKEQILALMDSEITAINAAALTNKLVQFANGAIYTTKPEYVEVHAQKLDALTDIIEAANGHPVLVFYSFQSDLARIKKHLKKYEPEIIKGPESVKKWNRQQIQVGLAHPNSAGHGLNLQAGGSIIVWYGIPWSLEAYMQANARLHRQGQTEIVIVHHLVMKGTVDEDIIAALTLKFDGQERLMQALKFRIDRVRKILTALN